MTAHTSVILFKFLSDTESPLDLSPTENLWAELKRAVDKRKAKKVKDLARICVEEWSKNPPNMFLNLVTQYRKRLHSVILTRGGCTEKLNRCGNIYETSILVKSIF